ncbi:hypothetical protein Salat_2990000, partial [Sesamum alatum]
RRILIKWWDKFEFFKDSVFSVRGIIDLEPITPTKSTKSKKEISEVLKELLSSASKKDLKNQIKELLESSDDEDEEMMRQEHRTLGSYARCSGSLSVAQRPTSKSPRFEDKLLFSNSKRFSPLTVKMMGSDLK